MELKELLLTTRKYVAQAGQNAEAKHDSHGEYYMDYGQYEIMQETDKLLIEIDKAILEL